MSCTLGLEHVWVRESSSKFTFLVMCQFVEGALLVRGELTERSRYMQIRFKANNLAQLEEVKANRAEMLAAREARIAAKKANALEASS